MVREHREAFGRYRTNRYSERIKADFDAMYGWPGARAAGRSVTAGEQPGDPGEQTSPAQRCRSPVRGRTACASGARLSQPGRSSGLPAGDLCRYSGTDELAKAERMRSRPACWATCEGLSAVRPGEAAPTGDWRRKGDGQNQVWRRLLQGHLLGGDASGPAAPKAGVDANSRLRGAGRCAHGRAVTRGGRRHGS